LLDVVWQAQRKTKIAGGIKYITLSNCFFIFLPSLWEDVSHIYYR
jgi:hypothetical protein